MSRNDFKPSLSDEIHDRKPMTVKELQQRLKHIAGLCWGLSIDLNNEIERNERQAAEIKNLQAQIMLLGGGNLKISPEELEAKKRAKKREYNARYLAKKKAAQGGNNN